MKLWGLAKLFAVLFVVLLQGILQFGAVIVISPLIDVVFRTSRYFENPIVSRFSDITGYNLSIQQVMLGVIAMQVLTMIANLGAEYVKFRTYESFICWLKTSMVDKAGKRPYSFFIKESTARLMTELDIHSDLYSNSIFWPFLQIVSRFVVICFLVAACISLSPQYAFVIIAIGAGFYIIMTYLLKKKRRKMSTESNIAGQDKTRVLLYIIQGIKSVIMSNAMGFHLNEFSHAQRKIAHNAALTPLLANAPRYLIECLAMSLMVLYFNIILTRGGDLELASIGGLAFAGYRMLPLFQQIYGEYGRMQTQLFAMDSINKHLLVAEDVESGNDKLNPDVVQVGNQIGKFSNSLKTHNLSFSYDGRQESTIRWPDIEIRRGSTAGIFGPSGCGKSTLLDLMLGLLSPQAGEITIDGVALSKENRRQWHEQLGYVGQDIFLIEGTIKDNIIFGKSIESEDAAVIDAAKKAHIHDFIQGLPEGYNTPSGDRGIRLSGGQKQRIVIARALLNKPSVLILDEATSALDEETESAIIDTLCELSGQMTVIMVTHRRSTLEQADQVIELR